MWSPEFNGERDAVTERCAGNCSMGHRAELCANLTVQHVLTIQQLACVLRPKPGAAARFFTWQDFNCRARAPCLPAPRQRMRPDFPYLANRLCTCIDIDQAIPGFALLS